VGMFFVEILSPSKKTSSFSDVLSASNAYNYCLH
jgi:hypothetical protein